MISPKKRNALVEAHLDLIDPIAKNIAKTLPPCFELDDLRQAGALGLMRAAAGFEPGRARRGTETTLFRAYARRCIDGEIRESVRRRRYREATQEELLPERHDQPITAIPIDQAIGFRERSHRVAQALDGLPSGDRRVIEMYYFKGALLSEVGEEMGVKQTRASQLLKQAHARMAYELHIRGVNAQAA